MDCKLIIVPVHFNSYGGSVQDLPGVSQYLSEGYVISGMSMGTTISDEIQALFVIVTKTDDRADRRD